MSKSNPFYHTVSCTKVSGGKRSLWQARKPGVELIGAGNTADNAIKDLQKMIRARQLHGGNPV